MDRQWTYRAPERRELGVGVHELDAQAALEEHLRHLCRRAWMSRSASQTGVREGHMQGSIHLPTAFGTYLVDESRVVDALQLEGGAEDRLGRHLGVMTPWDTGG